MGNIINKAGQWLVNAVKDALVAPLDEMRKDLMSLSKAQEALAKTVESKHASDPTALECDLSLLDDRICYLIDKARERGYTTAGERRRVDRMHCAYRARGGNHGEELEYQRYTSLPTKEDWERSNI